MTSFICSKCGRKFPLGSKAFKCSCGGLFDLKFEPHFPIANIEQRPHNMWRYREALPIESDRSIVTMSEGYTPLIEEEICGKNVFIKMDHLLPTGSYKDRGASLLVSYAREHQVSSLVEDSSGNAGCSIAAYSARAGISCEIFVPDHTSVGKLRQIEAYGSKVRLVEGSREDVSRKILEQTKENFYASHVYNPLFLHGTKTLAFEICEQLGWKSPGAIVVPVGNGTLLLGASIGFGELYSAGIVDHLPKIIAVQAENCAPLLRAFEMNQKDSADVNAEATVSEGIAIEKPVRGAQILKAVRDSGGTFVGVSEQEIIETWKEMSKRGHFVEPTSAATIAGLKKYISKTDPNETIASVFTGHGLKTACELFSWNKQ